MRQGKGRNVFVREHVRGLYFVRGGKRGNDFMMGGEAKKALVKERKAFI